jgi:hypothetical protein
MVRFDQRLVRAEVGAQMVRFDRRLGPVPGPLGGEIIIWSMFGRSLELPLLLPPPPDPHLAMPDLRERFFSRRSRSR